MNHITVIHTCYNSPIAGLPASTSGGCRVLESERVLHCALARQTFHWELVETILEGYDLLLYNSCIVVPPSLRKETMLKIHEGHQGMERCRERVRSSLWWPGVTNQVKMFVENCRECAKVACMSTERTPATDSTTRLPIASGGIRFVWIERRTLFVSCWLFLSLPGSYRVIVHNIQQYHCTVKENLCSTRDTRSSKDWQWSSVCGQRVFSVCKNLQVPAYYK